MIRRRCNVVGLKTTRITLVVGLAVFTQVLGIFSGTIAQAQISYTTVGGSYTQDFNTLPTSPTNTSLGASPAGWTDDNASPGSNFSIPGWYLYHGNLQAEGGFNGHQRMRIGAGTANTGAFWSFGDASDTDRALGSLGSSTTTPQNIALRLTNNSGSVLGQFTLSYTGEQWRDGGAAAPNAQTLNFGYAVTPNASPPANIGALSVTTFSGLTFTSPTFTNTGSGTGLNGNDTANKTLISATVAGFTWNPGEDLWLRWNHPDAAGNDHGLGIDDLTFSANVPAEVNSAQTGLASVGTTWSDGQPAGPGKGYHVISGHTVTLDGAFLGSKLSVENGTVDINAGGSNQFFGAITVEPGGNLTESVAGDVSIGSDATSGLKLNRDVAFNLDAGSTLSLKAALTGIGNLNFNEASPGSANNAQATVDAASGAAYTGIIRFNAGKQLNVIENAGLNTVEMNSTQAAGNILNYGPKVSTTISRLTFNQPGTLIHATNNPTGTAGQRLQSVATLIVNAATTLDLSATLDKEERRLLVSGFQGSGNILVKGTAADPTNANAGSGTSPNFTGITRNEFEVGAQGTDPSGGSESYSGTISTQDHVNVEIRRSLPSARFEVNQNGILETGGQDIPLPNSLGTTLGEVQVNGGGVLEVGFEQANAQNGIFTVGHHVNRLRLTNRNGRSGSLTLTGGATPSTLRMQVQANATSFATEFDSIVASGNVVLDGNLEVLVNPVSCTGNDPCGANANGIVSLNVGDTYDFISIDTSVRGDYDGNGSVGPEDYEVWRGTQGNGVGVGTGADGNANGFVDAADYVLWRNGGATGTLGSITGSFDSIKAFDAQGVEMTNVTFEVVLNGSNTLAQLRVAAISGSGSAVPEPTTVVLLSLALGCFAFARPQRD